MKSNSYTLDRFEGDYAVFLKRPDEVEQLLIHRMDLTTNIRVGSIVSIEDTGQRYIVRKLKHETAAAEQRVSSLLAKLQAKNKSKPPV